MPQSRYLAPACLVLLGTATRVLPYVLHRLGVADAYDPNGMPWNLSPLGAIALFGGACLADRRSAFAVSLLTLVLGDIGIGLLMREVAFGFHALTPVVYGSLALMVWMGTWMRPRLQDRSYFLTRVIAVGGTALVAELTFFVVTNFANWALQESIAPTLRRYSYTPAGLVACFVAALPFFKNSLAGMAVYGTALFGGYGLLAKRAPARQQAMLFEAN